MTQIKSRPRRIAVRLIAQEQGHISEGENLPQGAWNPEWGDFPTDEAIQAKRFDVRKLFKISKIKEARDAEWQSKLTTPFGAVFYTDVQTQLDITFMIQTLADGATFPGYKCADGVYRDITKEQFQLALNEGVTRKIAAYAKEVQLTQAITAATTVEELNAITW